MTLHVEVVVADRRLWAGDAGMVIAKTLDGDIGLLTDHPPVLGILAEGSVVRILDPESPEGGAGDAAGGEVTAAVSGGFLSVADNRVSVLAVDAQLGTEVDTSAARSDLESALGDAGTPSAGEEPSEAKYARAQLRAAGEQA
ncbi:MAG: F0F1 ATP synthase subunit epsilon [Streptosporangiaceae bacterium]